MHETVPSANKSAEMVVTGIDLMSFTGLLLLVIVCSKAVFPDLTSIQPHHWPIQLIVTDQLDGALESRRCHHGGSEARYAEMYNMSSAVRLITMGAMIGLTREPCLTSHNCRIV